MTRINRPLLDDIKKHPLPKGIFLLNLKKEPWNKWASSIQIEEARESNHPKNFQSSYRDIESLLLLVLQNEIDFVIRGFRQRDLRFDHSMEEIRVLDQACA